MERSVLSPLKRLRAFRLDLLDYQEPKTFILLIYTYAHKRMHPTQEAIEEFLDTENWGRFPLKESPWVHSLEGKDDGHQRAEQRERMENTKNTIYKVSVRKKTSNTSYRDFHQKQLQ